MSLFFKKLDWSFVSLHFIKYCGLFPMTARDDCVIQLLIRLVARASVDPSPPQNAALRVALFHFGKRVHGRATGFLAICWNIVGYMYSYPQLLYGHTVKFSEIFLALSLNRKCDNLFFNQSKDPITHFIVISIKHALPSAQSLLRHLFIAKRLSLTPSGPLAKLRLIQG